MSQQYSPNRPSGLEIVSMPTSTAKTLIGSSWLALGLAAACGLAELLSGLIYRLGWAGLKPSLLAMRWSATSAAVIFVVALIGTVVAARRQIGKAKSTFLWGSMIALLAATPPAVLWYRVQHLPRLHDITTDTENPPPYISVLPFREGAPNSTTYDTQLARLQLEGYPDIKPVVVNTAPKQAFQKALQVARDMGWAIVEAVDTDENSMRIEATDTSFLFGFKDDIVIRIKAESAGSRIDLRSLSRVGGSDFGVNANRIRSFITRLKVVVD